MMGPILFHIFILCLIGGVLRVLSFQPRPHHALSSRRGLGTTCYWLGDAKSSPEAPSDSKKKKDNKAMAFLKEIGKVGREANRDFRYAIGVDEGSSGKSAGNGMNELRKARHAYKSCIETGVIDDMSEDFPTTSCGTHWAGFTDRVMGGVSMGTLTRETFGGRTCNVLRGKVSLANNGGFVQMAAPLAADGASSNTVDATTYDGVELDVQSGGEGDTESFNVHLKNSKCSKPFSSYRATFLAPIGKWGTVRLPWSNFRGHGPVAEEIPFDASILTRAGIVAIGREMDVVLAVSGFRFYKET